MNDIYDLSKHSSEVSLSWSGWTAKPFIARAFRNTWMYIFDEAITRSISKNEMNRSLIINLVTLRGQQNRVHDGQTNNSTIQKENKILV